MVREIAATLIVLFAISIFQAEAGAGDLRIGYYAFACPRAEQIVASVINKSHSTYPRIAASLIRLLFHDCFVTGCDASILLDSSPSGDAVEKYSLANGASLRGAEVIDDIKAQLEEECPGVVSCADILAFAARDAMVLAGLPYHFLPAGRRDSLTSLDSNVKDNLPLPNWSTDQMIKLFVRKGFTIQDMVVLLGAHSVGSAHCGLFNDRLYDYKLTGKPDPALNLAFVNELKKQCPNPKQQNGGDPLVDFDPVSPNTLDNKYYINLLEGKALLPTDQSLVDDERTLEIVRKLADHPGLFSLLFVRAMTRMGTTEVLTGDQGEIRSTCRSVN